MPWVEFTRTVQYETGGRHLGPTFEAGTRHKFDDAFAGRWVRRGVAFAVDGPHKSSSLPEEKPAAVETKDATIEAAAEAPAPRRATRQTAKA